MNTKISEVKRMWNEFENIPIDNNENITEPFHTHWSYGAMAGVGSFSVGTNRYEIWHWFEDTFDVSINEDILEEKKSPLEPEEWEIQLGRKEVEFTTQFLPQQTVISDKKDWNIYQWHIFALDYLMSNWDHAIEEGEPEYPFEIPQYFEEGSPLWSRICQALRMEGNYDDALNYMQEHLTFEQFDEIESFFNWCKEKQIRFGHGTYMSAYLQFKFEQSESQVPDIEEDKPGE